MIHSPRLAPWAAGPGSSPTSPVSIKVPRTVSPNRRCVGFDVAAPSAIPPLALGTGPLARAPGHTAHLPELARADSIVGITQCTQHIAFRRQGDDFERALNMLVEDAAAFVDKLLAALVPACRLQVVTHLSSKLSAALAPDGTSRRKRFISRDLVAGHLVVFELTVSQRMQSVATPLQSAEIFSLELAGRAVLASAAEAEGTRMLQKVARLPSKLVLPAIGASPLPPRSPSPTRPASFASDDDDANRNSDVPSSALAGSFTELSP